MNWVILCAGVLWYEGTNRDDCERECPSGKQFKICQVTDEFIERRMDRIRIPTFEEDFD